MRAADLFQQFSRAGDEGGKPVWKQLLEVASLRFSKSPIGISEYFEYGIYRRGITARELQEFIGWKRSLALDRLLNNDYSRVLANDKLLNYLILHTAGCPMPQPVATYSTTGRRVADERVLQTLDEVRAFLDEDCYPFYVKPISAGYGRGVLGVQAKEGAYLRLLDGNRVSVHEFMKPFSFAPFGGMLFQKPLQAHPVIAQLTGSSAVCCVRFICFVTPKGPVVHTAFWKVTAGRNMLDNFSHGSYGNCLASIDIDRGTIVRAIAKLGPGGEVTNHPTTKQAMVGFALPDWDKAVALVCSATRHFPGLRLQNWDVALCPQGPVLLELNTESELAVPQAISGRGFYDERLRTLLADIDSGEQVHRQHLAAGPDSQLVRVPLAQQV